jgi:hypothetical protein
MRLTIYTDATKATDFTAWFLWKFEKFPSKKKTKIKSKPGQ